MNQLQTDSEREIHFDEDRILAAYEEKDNNHQSLSIKILSIFGGIMACLTFLGFIFMADVFDSSTGASIFGILCIVGSSLISRISRKTIIDTLSVSFFITGFVLLGFGLFSKGDTIFIAFTGLALGTLFLVQSYILSFISVLIINGTIITYSVTEEVYNLLPVMIIFQTLMITFLFTQEAKIISINRLFSKLYDPVRSGIVFSFILTLLFIESDFLPRIIGIGYHYYDWVPSLVIVLAILYVVFLLFNTLKVSNTTYKIIIYALTVLFLSPTLLTSTISGAILIVLLSFFVNYKTGFVLGIIALIVFIGRFYYDLQFSLLTKSILLFASGVIFLIIYFLTHKKLTANEKI